MKLRKKNIGNRKKHVLIARTLALPPLCLSPKRTKSSLIPPAAIQLGRGVTDGTASPTNVTQKSFFLHDKKNPAEKGDKTGHLLSSGLPVFIRPTTDILVCVNLIASVDLSDGVLRAQLFFCRFILIGFFSIPRSIWFRYSLVFFPRFASHLTYS